MSDKGEYVKENVYINIVFNVLEKMCGLFFSLKGMCNVCLFLSVIVVWFGKRKQFVLGFVIFIFKDMKWMYNECQMFFLVVYVS